MGSDALKQFDLLLSQQGPRLIRTLEGRNGELLRVGQLLYGTAVTLRQREWKTHEAIWGPCLFLNTAAYDLSVLMLEFLRDSDDWKRRLMIRFMALVLYETVDDLPTVFGKDFRASISALNLDGRLHSSFNTELKKVSAFKTSHGSDLKEIRTICAAHRDHDAILLQETIENLDLFKVVETGVQLGTILNELGSSAQAIIKAASLVRPPESPTDSIS